jgi:hypothetical protein
MLLEEESPAYGDGSARQLIKLACDNRASAHPLPRFGIFPVFPEPGKGERALGKLEIGASFQITVLSNE